MLERAAEGDEFVVLACDGIWDVMSNEELCEFVRSRLQVFDDLERVCNAVVDTCLHKVHITQCFCIWISEQRLLTSNWTKSFSLVSQTQRIYYCSWTRPKSPSFACRGDANTGAADPTAL